MRGFGLCILVVGSWTSFSQGKDMTLQKETLFFCYFYQTHVFFLHQAIFQFSVDTEWVSNNLTHSSTNCLALAQTPHVQGSVPQDCPPPTSDANYETGPLILLTDLLYIRGSSDHLVLLNNLLDWHTKLKKALCLLLHLYYKRYNSGTAKWKRCIWQGLVKGHGASMPSWEHLSVFNKLEALQTFWLGF